MQPRLNVLVVDDEPALREVLTLRLNDWGHAVRAVGTVADADRELTRSPADLVLCDVVLPGGSGIGLLLRIRERDTRLPVVMMTAHGSIDLAVDAMKSGATDLRTGTAGFSSSTGSTTTLDCRFFSAVCTSPISLGRSVTLRALWLT